MWRNIKKILILLLVSMLLTSCAVEDVHRNKSEYRLKSYDIKQVVGDSKAS